MALSSGDAPFSWSILEEDLCLVSAQTWDGGTGRLDRPNLCALYPKPLCPAWPLSWVLFVLWSRLRGMWDPTLLRAPLVGRVLGGPGRGVELAEVAAEVGADHAMTQQCQWVGNRARTCCT